CSRWSWADSSRVIAAWARMNDTQDSSFVGIGMALIGWSVPCALKCSRQLSVREHPRCILRYMRPERNGIEVESLVRQFKEVRRVDRIDLRIEPGEIFGFLGPNGAGKSTTVHVRAALQETALDPFLSGREHLRLQASLHGIRGERRAELIDGLL